MQELSISYNINEFIDAFNYFGDVKFDVQKVTLDSLTDEGVGLAVALNLKSSRNTSNVILPIVNSVSSSLTLISLIVLLVCALLEKKGKTDSKFMTTSLSKT
jgi:hypothetical protein